MDGDCVQPAERPALAAVGGGVDSSSKRKEPKARQMPKNAARTHRQLHALLGGVLAFKSLMAMVHQFATPWHIPEVAHHHAHGFGSRKENLPV